MRFPKILFFIILLQFVSVFGEVRTTYIGSTDLTIEVIPNNNALLVQVILQKNKKITSAVVNLINEQGIESKLKFTLTERGHLYLAVCVDKNKKLKVSVIDEKGNKHTKSLDLTLYQIEKLKSMLVPTQGKGNINTK